jgi:hypothetical protein
MAQLTRLILILTALATVPGAALGAQVGTTGVHLSPQLAAGPGGSPLLVAMTDHGSGTPRTEMWRSLNAGAAWTRVPTPPLAPPPTAIDPVEARGTPAVAFGASDAYVAFEGTEVQGGIDEPCSPNSGVFVARSNDGAASFAPAVQVAPSTATTVRGRPSVVEFPYPSGPDALTAVEARPCGNPSALSTVEVYYAYYGFYLRKAAIAGRHPVLAAGGGQVYLAYLTGVGTAAKIEVRRCALDGDGSVTCSVRGSTSPFTAVTSLPVGGRGDQLRAGPGRRRVRGPPPGLDGPRRGADRGPLQPLGRRRRDVDAAPGRGRHERGAGRRVPARRRRGAEPRQPRPQAGRRLVA